MPAYPSWFVLRRHQKRANPRELTSISRHYCNSGRLRRLRGGVSNLLAIHSRFKCTHSCHALSVVFWDDERIATFLWIESLARHDIENLHDLFHSFRVRANGRQGFDIAYSWFLLPHWSPPVLITRKHIVFSLILWPEYAKHRRRNEEQIKAIRANGNQRKIKA